MMKRWNAQIKEDQRLSFPGKGFEAPNETWYPIFQPWGHLDFIQLKVLMKTIQSEIFIDLRIGFAYQAYFPLSHQYTSLIDLF